LRHGDGRRRARVTATDPGFTTLSKADGYLLERRPVRDSAFYEYRVSVDLDAAASSVCDAVFAWGTHSSDHERVLEETGDLRVAYDQVQASGLVSPRDFAFSVRRQRGATVVPHRDCAVQRPGSSAAAGVGAPREAAQPVAVRAAAGRRNARHLCALLGPRGSVRPRWCTGRNAMRR